MVTTLSPRLTTRSTTRAVTELSDGAYVKSLARIADLPHTTYVLQLSLDGCPSARPIPARIGNRCRNLSLPRSWC